MHSNPRTLSIVNSPGSLWCSCGLIRTVLVRAVLIRGALFPHAHIINNIEIPVVIHIVGVTGLIPAKDTYRLKSCAVIV